MDEQTKNIAEETSPQKFESDVLKSEIPVLVDFWASWCQPCLMMAPVLDDMANTFPDELKILKLNTENPEAQQLSMKYNIRSIPNMKLFYKGKIVAEFVGYRPKEVLQNELTEALEKLKTAK